MITVKVFASNIKGSNTDTNLKSVLFLLDALSALLLLLPLVCVMVKEDEEEEDELLTVGLNL